MERKLNKIFKLLIFLLILLVLTSLGLTAYSIYYKNELVEKGEDISENIGEIK